MKMAAYQQVHKHLDPIDTDVKLPAAIRAAAAKSNALHQQAYNTTVEDAPAQGTDGEDRQTTEAKSEAPANTGEKAPEPKAPASDNDSWEHKYTSLKGRYDKQDGTIASLTHELGNLRAEIASLRASAAVVPPVRTNENSFKKLTEEERENYGDDFLDVSARAAQERLSPEIDALKQQIAQLSGKVEHVSVQTHQQQTMTLNEFLTSKLPNWQVINRDPKFLAWVNLPDPFSGVIRVNMMREAHAKGDAHRVLNFFTGFLTDEAAVDPARAKQDFNPNEGKVRLENFAAPGRAKASAASSVVPGEKETISRAQIANFYKLVNAGHYRGNDAEKNRLEQMIFDAERDGRIVN